jgi:hypothetical protein
MYDYRQIIHRIRMGQTDREIARTKIIGRSKCGQIRAIAQEKGWLAGESPLPDDAALSEVFAKKAPSNPTHQSKCHSHVIWGYFNSWQTRLFILLERWTARIAIAMLGSCLGFLPFNFSLRRPASIFLGDAGSTFFGFVLAALAIKADWADNNPIVSFATPVLIFWVLIYDMAYISIERVVTGKVKSFQGWIDYVGTDHIHHRLLVIFGDRRKVVFFIFFLCATLGISAITLRGASTSDGILTVVQAFLITVIVSILEYSGRNHTK